MAPHLVAALLPLLLPSADAASCQTMPGKVVGESSIQHIANVASAGACCDACSSHSGCVAFTWNGPGYSKDPNGCWLKDNAVDAGKTRGDSTSGLRAGPSPSPSPSPSPGLRTEGFACQPPHDTFPFCNLSLSVHDRVLDLISRIDSGKKGNLMTARGQGGKGKDMQSFPELGVPAYYWGTNCLHSLNSGSCVVDSHGKTRCPVNFPSGPSFGAMFDRGLVRQMSEAIGKELRVQFSKTDDISNKSNSLDCWGPVLNLNRDPRWGRNGEGGLEDAYAMGELAKAWTQGFQSPRPSKLDSSRQILQGVITLKHQAVNSLENTYPLSRHTFDGNATYGVDPFVLQDYYHRPFRAPIKEADARGVMCSYNSVLGVPTCLSSVMRDVRQEWGFQGYVTSDSDSIRAAYVQHQYAGGSRELAVALALTDGQCDINSGDTYVQGLPDALSAGTGGLTESDVDRALYNSLKQRFDLGLFDPPAAYDWPSVDDVGSDASAELNLLASQSSLVLLRNDQEVLPLTPGRRIAVLGPHAKGQEIMTQPYPFKPACPGGGTNNYDCIVSPFSAIEAINNAAGGSTETAAGCDLFDPSEAGFAAALELAQAADVIVLGLGIEVCGITPAHNVNPHASSSGHCFQEGGNLSGSYVFPDQYMEREGHDRTIIDLPPVQRRLAAEVMKLGKPVILYLMNAGALAIDDVVSHAGPAPLAIIEAFYPGPRGGEALAQGMFGLHNRWGRMPYTIYPSSFVDEASMLEHDLRVAPGRTYRYNQDAVYSFGHGLSLTTWSLTGNAPSCLSKLSSEAPDTQCRISLSLTNTGSRTGDSVVLAYFRRSGWQQQVGESDGGRRLMPQIRQLFDFQRLPDVEAGASATVTFEVTATSFAEAQEASGDWAIAPGDLTLVFEDGTGASVELATSIAGNLVVLESFPSVAPAPSPTPGGLDTLASGATLESGKRLVSSNGNVRLEMQKDDGDLVLFEDRINDRGVDTVTIWSAGTSGHPGAHASFQRSDGNFVVRDSSGALWSSGKTDGAAKLVLRDDCNLVKVDDSLNVVWSLGTSCASATLI